MGKRKRQKRRRWHPILDESDDRDPLQVLFDRVLETPQAAGILESFQGLLDRAGNAIDPATMPRRPRTQIPQGRTGHTPQAPRRRPDPTQVARMVMQFGPAEPLTSEKISKQRRALAALCHPDAGGSTEAMARLNQAADLLLGQLK